jgi:nitrous oxidase accessory protein NosD
MLEYAEGSRIDHCVFEYATWGVHSHFTNLKVTDSVFRNNSGGMRFRSGPVLITRSVFRGNGIGIRSFRGNAVIRENLITDNETGIFVREKGGGLTVSANNLSGNKEYGMRIGDFNDEDVSAKENWWGTGDPSQYLFDGRTEPGIGIVRYEPYLHGPVKLEGIAP